MITDDKQKGHEFSISAAIAIILGLLLFASSTYSQESIDLSYLHSLPEGECRAILIFAVYELLGDVYDLQVALTYAQEALAAVREDLAEQRGRSNAQTGMAAGIPSTIGAVILYILRRNGRKKKENS